jgi:hypothetical protein
MYVPFSEVKYVYSWLMNVREFASCEGEHMRNQCCGSGMFYPGSKIRIPNFFIPDPDPGSRIRGGEKAPDPGSRILPGTVHKNRDEK